MSHLHLFHYFTVIKGSVKRYLQIDLNYRFQLVTDVIDLLLLIVAFTILGAFVDSAADPGELGIDYNLQGFLLMGVLFWALFQRSYEDTVNTIPEEASRGTIGFLVTNNVNLSTLLISRNIASMIKTVLMTLLIVLPILLIINWFKGAQLFAGFQWSHLPLIFGVFFLMWLFMLVVSMAIASLNIVSKRVTPFANMVLNGLKVLSGYYFPLEALDNYLGTGLAEWLKFNVPIITGLVFLRDIVLTPNNDIGAAEAWNIYIQPILIGTLVTAIFALGLYKYLERRSQRWGSLEFY